MVDGAQRRPAADRPRVPTFVLLDAEGMHGQAAGVLVQAKGSFDTVGHSLVEFT
jgi:hypothetical protein